MTEFQKDMVRFLVEEWMVEKVKDFIFASSAIDTENFSIGKYGVDDDCPFEYVYSGTSSTVESFESRDPICVFEYLTQHK